MDIEDINELIKSQENDYYELGRILTNIKKDSTLRKTQKYIDDRRQIVDTIFAKTTKNHKILSEQEILSSHRYLTTNYYEKNLLYTYSAIIDLLDGYQGNLNALAQNTEEAPDKPLTQNVNQNTSNPKIMLQMFRITKLKKKIRQAEDAIKEEKPVWHLQSIVQTIQKQWEEFESAHKELLVESSNDHDYFTQCNYEKLESDYEMVTEKLQETIYMMTHNAQSKPTGKLPQIQIPVFTGKFEHWNTFKDLFLKVIHEDRTISNTEKMQYLMSHIQGDAARVIHYLPISECNYETAWMLLAKRYDDKRKIVNNYIDRLLDLRKVEKSDATQLRELCDIFNECLEALKNQGINTTSWGPMLGRILTKKWDKDTNIKYEEQLEESTRVQNFSEMMIFLEKRFKCLQTTQELFTSNLSRPHGSQLSFQYYKGVHQNHLNGNQTPQKRPYKQCWYCEESGHTINQCAEFEALRIDDRIKVVIKKEMCRKCLNHSALKPCLSNYYKQCQKCQCPDHNTLLHLNYREKSSDATNEIKSSGSSNKVRSNISGITKHDTETVVFLATILVKITTNNGMTHLLRVLIDQGSEASFCTEETAQLLSYPRTRITAEIKGIGDDKPKIAHYSINATLQPIQDNEYRLPVTLIILPKLTGTLPRNNLQQIDPQFLKNKEIADPTYYKKGHIDIILGAQEYSKILLQGLEKINDSILAQNTEFGWILSGFCPTDTKKDIKLMSLITRTKEVKQLTQFWELEEVHQNMKLSKDDELCEAYYKKTTKRNPDGTYTVRLPFKSSKGKLGESRKKAAARLFQLEKQFGKNEDIRNKYLEFMTEYLDMGHMKRINKRNHKKGNYYIPHQPVIRDDSLTTKLRVVFDASSKTDKNTSLNSNLYKGPKLQQDISTILLRWRFHKIAFMSDIMKMYRCIQLHEQDQSFQRILWRFSPNQPIEEYALTTVTYGTTSAPYLAVKTLQQLAIDEQENYPMASKVTLQDFYVDDILSGADNITTAKKLQVQLIAMLEKGGFKLRKWSSNSEEFLRNIECKNNDDQLLKLPVDENRKSLGVVWSPREDNFHFQITITNNNKPSKRFILSEVAKIFDPLGWLAPIIITMKLLVQELWTTDINWDQPVNESHKKRWLEIQDKIKNIEKIKIPRWCHTNNTKIMELHGFSDASEKAYGAAVYCRIISNDSYRITLLQAKSKVAPKKQKTTLPRLELCAALLLTKLTHRIYTSISILDTNIYCWTDSMITLGWIKGDAERWQTFISNRVSEIQQLIPNAKWNHVPSEENPADLISRGIDPQKLQDLNLWWNGPPWLQTNKLPLTKTIPEQIHEIKNHGVTSVRTKINDIWDRFSDITRMVRTLSYCYRILHKQPASTTLSLEEIKRTTKQILKLVQAETFPNELKILQNKEKLPNSSKISTLDPFIDIEGIIRVGGRLHNSNLPFSQKHPIILLHSHYVITLIIRDAHLKTLHGGNQLTLAYLRQKYWIIGGKKKIKTIINKCVKCIRYKANTASQKMGILPKPRVTQSNPFSHTGVDFAGPIQIRAMKGRGHKSYKAYVAVFVCLATKAIHMELVGDLTTETFIAALRRFMARRGHVSHMYSDNATNFVGTANFLYQEILQITQSSQFKHAVTNMGTEWHFIPPSSPHFGGIWEAAVKSLKHHLRRVIGESTLTYEEMTTLLHQIEACLNSRPLCPLNEDINDSTVLTPSHFLIGREAVGIPDPIENINTDLINRWKLIQRMKKDLWNSWTKDYLHQLQQRYKWKQNYENLKVGTAVLIKDENISPSKWPLAKVTQIFVGPDNNTRVVNLQRSNGNIQKRAVHNLIPLPVNENDSVAESQDENYLVTTTIQTRKQKTKASTLKTILFTILLMFQIINSAAATWAYTLKNIGPGFYVEQIGTTTIDRGTFRIETYFSREKMKQDLGEIINVTKQFKYLCIKIEETTYETHCYDFFHHLNEEKTKFENTVEYLTEIEHTRRKRGLLGKFLTSIFGVNDEVYKDIDTLQENQNKLIEATNHQTKLMISAITTVNQTEKMIQSKLERFQTRLNQVIQQINDQNVWYKSINNNQIKIQVIQTYNLANNYISETIEHYVALLQIYLENAVIYTILPPKTIRETIKKANEKLPPNLKIVQTQLIRTKITENSTHIQIYAYYPIHDTSKYTLIHITPVPEKNKDGSFTNSILQQTFMGVDYNRERYFELSYEEFKKCLRKNSDFICYPVAVKNMQSNENCIVNHIFKTHHDHDRSGCISKIFNVTSDVLWKQLYMPNTWLFVPTKPTTASIVCDGQREEVILQDIGILHISENCVIKTTHSLLSAKRIETMTALASFIKPINFSIDTKLLTSKVNPDITKEEIIDTSKDLFQNIINSEKALQTQLDNTSWKQIQNHSYLVSFSSSTLIIFLVIILFCFRRQVKKWMPDRCGRKTPIPRTTEIDQADQTTTTAVPPRKPPRTNTDNQQNPPETIELYQLSLNS